MRLQFSYKRARLIKYFTSGVILIYILDYFGVFLHLFEKDFGTEFHYPYDGDISQSIQQLRRQEIPDIPQINVYNYTFLHKCETKCRDTYKRFMRPRLVYLIKSSLDNFERRLAIRKSWGYEHRFSDVLVRTVFILGSHRGDNELQEKIFKESQRYNDIVQAEFHDSYFNNTIKTLTALKWAVDFCPLSKFYMFVDDDMYVSTKNVLRFIRYPTHYPEYLLEPIYALQRQNRMKRSSAQRNETQLTSKRPSLNETVIITNERTKRQVFDFELPSEVRLLAGYVFLSAPHRHKTSKWYISLEEYPYDMWPPYVTAGAYILSREALLDIYFASTYTKCFRFDDIYLGIVAMKANIEPYHCEEFYFYKKQYTVHNYRFVIASHGYGDTNELLRVWNEQKSAGNA